MLRQCGSRLKQNLYQCLIQQIRTWFQINLNWQTSCGTRDSKTILTSTFGLKLLNCTLQNSFFKSHKKHILDSRLLSYFIIKTTFLLWVKKVFLLCFFFFLLSPFSSLLLIWKMVLLCFNYFYNVFGIQHMGNSAPESWITKGLWKCNNTTPKFLSSVTLPPTSSLFGFLLSGIYNLANLLIKFLQVRIYSVVVLLLFSKQILSWKFILKDFCLNGGGKEIP